MIENPQWAEGLKLWLHTLRQKEVSFESYQQIKAVWINASGWNVDRVPRRNIKGDTFGGDFDLYIFDVHGTHCRIVTRINQNNHNIFIRFVGSHSDYDKWCKANIK